MKMFDPVFFKSSRFILFVISNFLLYAFYDVPYIYLGNYSLDAGFSKDQSALLLSVIGMFNMVGEVSR